MTELPSPLLVDMPNWLGDLCHTVPALQRLLAANAGARSALLVPAAHVPLAFLLGWEGVTRPPGAGLWWARRNLKGRFRVAISARHASRAKLLLAGCGAPLRLASQGRGAGLLGVGTFAVDRDRHQRYDLDAGLARLGVAGAGDGPARLALDDPWQERGRRLRAKLSTAHDVVALLPGAHGMPAKRYPARAFAAVASQLAECGVATLVVVGPGEEELGNEVAAGASAPVAPTALSLAEVAALLVCCDAAVGHDSGLTHLAALAGCRTVALFGPTDPARTAPVGGSIVLRSRILADLDPARIAAAVLPLLGSRPTP